MLMINTVNATVQANVTDALRGRVMSLYVMVFAGTSPIGGIFAGAVAERWDAPAAFLAGGVISVAGVVLVAWRWWIAARRGQMGVTRLGQSIEVDTDPLGPFGDPEAARTPPAASEPAPAESPVVGSVRGRTGT
jgi:MFS family permease